MVAALARLSIICFQFVERLEGGHTGTYFVLV